MEIRVTDYGLRPDHWNYGEWQSAGVLKITPKASLVSLDPHFKLSTLHVCVGVATSMTSWKASICANRLTN